MPLRSYRPTSPGLRGMTRSTFEEITTREPHKPLLEPQKRDAGRNNTGRQTVRETYVQNKREQFRRWREQMKELQTPWTPELTLPDSDEWNRINPRFPIA